jgi:phosphoribosylformylglycinamidine cyclo-ligase
VKPLLAALRETKAIKALAHITGGGFVDNIPRVLPPHLSAEVDLDVLRPAPVFAWLARSGGVDDADMLRTFNCGIGMIAVVGADDVAAVTRVLTTAGEDVTRLGHLVPRGGSGVLFRGRVRW